MLLCMGADVTETVGNIGLEKWGALWLMYERETVGKEDDDKDKLMIEKKKV